MQKTVSLFCLLLLLSLGLFGSLSLTYCVWNKQTEVTSELQNELDSKLRSELQNELKCELEDVRNELHKLQNEMNSRMHLGASGLSQDKGQLKRNMRQADKDKDTNTVSTRHSDNTNGLRKLQQE